MGDKKQKNNLKCVTCEHYDKAADYCKEKCLEYCSKQVNTNFSQCEDYIIKGKLVMF